MKDCLGTRVAQASPPASSSTVPVRDLEGRERMGKGGGTSPELAAGTDAVHNPTGSLVSGFHFRGVLPHLKKEGGTYFVTFREAGTLPKEVLSRFKLERDIILQQAMDAKRPLTWHEQEELLRWYSSRVDKYLDAGQGVCHLRRPEFAALVVGAVRFFEGRRYELCSWAVMPNHVHVVVWPMPGHTLSDILHSWKSYTAHEINNVLPVKIVPFWQSESYEHLVRDDEDLQRCCNYTVMNPVNAGLCVRIEDWKWSSSYVTQASPPASSSTVPVRDPKEPERLGEGGGTPPELAAGTATLRNEAAGIEPKGGARVAQASPSASSRTVPVRLGKGA